MNPEENNKEELAGVQTPNETVDAAPAVPSVAPDAAQPAKEEEFGAPTAEAPAVDTAPDATAPAEEQTPDAEQPPAPDTAPAGPEQSVEEQPVQGSAASAPVVAGSDVAGAQDAAPKKSSKLLLVVAAVVLLAAAAAIFLLMS